MAKTAVKMARYSPIFFVTKKQTFFFTNFFSPIFEKKCKTYIFELGLVLRLGLGDIFVTNFSTFFCLQFFCHQNFENWRKN